MVQHKNERLLLLLLPAPFTHTFLHPSAPQLHTVEKAEGNVLSLSGGVFAVTEGATGVAPVRSFEKLPQFQVRPTSSQG